MPERDLQIPGWGLLSLLAVSLVLFLTGCFSTRADYAQLQSQVIRPDSAEVSDESLDIQKPFRVDRPELGLGRDFPDSTEPLLLSVEDAVVLALQNNRDLRFQQLEPVIQGAFARLERSRFDPEFYTNLQFGEEQITQTARSTGEQFDVFGKDSAGTVGVRSTLPTGTEVDVSLGVDRSISDRTPEQQSARLGVAINQPLLQGFGPKINLAQVRQAELETLASIWELRGFTEALLAEVESAYWRYVLAREQIRIFARSLELAEQQQKEVEERIEVGAIANNQAAVVRAEVASREQDLINARSLMESRRLQLLQLIYSGQRWNSGQQLDPTSSLDIEPLELAETRTWVETALSARPDLRQAELLYQSNALETRVTANGRLPRLDLFVDMGRTGFATTPDDAVGDIDSDTYDFTAGVRLNTLIGNREARALDLVARANRQQSLEALRNLVQLVEVEVRLALNEVERARQQIEASSVTRQLREQTLKAEQERFKVGSSTALLVAQAQRDLLASRISEVEAIVTYRIALIELYLAEGSLLERRGIRVETRAN